MIIGYNMESLDGWGITTEQVDYVLAQYNQGTELTKPIEFGESDNGNSTVLYVGFDQFGELLEVGVEYLDDMDWVYHARKAISSNRDKYSGE